jgi:hypothetical protein
MGQKSSSGESCFWLFVLIGFVGFILYQAGSFIYNAWQFVHRPDALARTMEFFQALGICCGLVVLFIIVLRFIPSSWMNSHDGSSDDDYYD